MNEKPRLHDPHSDVENDSAIQTEWIDISNKLREGLEKKLEGVENLTPAECFDLSRALREALWLDTNARSFDALTKKAAEQTSWS